MGEKRDWIYPVELRKTPEFVSMGARGKRVDGDKEARCYGFPREMAEQGLDKGGYSGEK